MGHITRRLYRLSWVLPGPGTFRFLVMLTGMCILVHCSALGCLELSEDAADPVMFEHSHVEEDPGGSQKFVATAYCDYGVTKSGALTEIGLVAADPAVLPLGSVIHVEAPRYGGIYQVMDTGSAVKGKIIDIYIPSLQDAVEFGRQPVLVTVLHYGRARPTFVSCSEQAPQVELHEMKIN
jgi:3D (Asp-Asp-Asp) domain-containing protein